MNTLIRFHGNCYDGYGAAWAAWRKFGVSALYQPFAWGEPFEIPDEVEALYLLDMSQPRAVLTELSGRHKLHVFKVLDHHKSAQEDLQDLPYCTFDLDKSGARLAWEFFHPDIPVPTLIRYIEDRDLWRYALPWSREIHAWLQSYPKEFDLWTKLSGRLDTEFEHVANEAKAIVRFKQMQVREMADQVQWAELGGHRVPIANATAFFSEVGEELCLRFPEANFAGYFLDRGDGQRQWGLRSRNGFDVSVIAKLYGGGGHPAASGFTSEPSWFPTA